MGFCEYDESHGEHRKLAWVRHLDTETRDKSLHKDPR